MTAVWQVSSPSQNLPFESFRKLLKGLCSPDQQSQPTKNQSLCKGDDTATVCSDQSSHCDEQNKQDFDSSCMNLSTLLDPIAELLRFCSPSTVIETYEDESYETPLFDIKSKSIDSDEVEVLECTPQEHDDCLTPDDFDDEVIVETVPGNPRIVRVYKALEMFSSAVVLVIIAIYLIILMDTTANIRMIKSSIQ